jgi:hypothetical protein
VNFSGVAGYKMTPPTPGGRSPALHPQSLELFRASGGKGSPGPLHLQELSPASSGGSYRAKMGLYAGKGYPFSQPSPSSPGQPYTLGSGNPSPSSPREGGVPVGGLPISVARSPSHKETFAKTAAGSHLDAFGKAGMLVNVERNVSGDSTTTSGSTASAGVASLSVENSPVTQPAHGAYSAGGSPVAGGSGVSPSFSYSPASYMHQTGVGGVGAFTYHHAMVEQSSSSSGQMGAAAMLPLKMRIGMAGSAASPPSAHPHSHHYPTPAHPPQPSHHAHSLSSPREHHLYTDRSKEIEFRLSKEAELRIKKEEIGVESVLAPPPAFADALPTGEGCPMCPSHSQSSQSSGVVSSSSSYAQGGSMDSGHVLSDESSCSAQHSAQVSVALRCCFLEMLS